MRLTITSMFLIVAGLLVSSCSAADESDADAAATDSDCAPGCSPVDASSMVADGARDEDSGEVIDPAYHVGTNVPGETASKFFTAAQDGMTVDAVYGAQGSWMIVVAARTNQFGCCVNRVDIEASIIGVDGSVYGITKYKRRPLFDGGDGFRYLMNTFVVVGDPAEWAGKEADLSLAITPTDGGETLSSTVRVSLHQTDLAL